VDKDIVDDKLKKFVKDHITSVAQLEILLLLHANPKQNWPVEKIVLELRTDGAGTRQQLGFLCQSALIQGDESNGYSFASDAEVLAITAALAQAYRLRRVTVVMLIFDRG
jgi:hypothetical protein